MSEMANVLGVSPSFEFEGRTYKVGPRDFEVEAMMAAELEARSLRAVQRYAGRMGPDEQKAQFDGWRRDVAAGVWDYGSPDFIAFYLSPNGARKAAYCQLLKHNPGRIDESVMDRVWADAAKWRELNELLAGANADPLTSGPPTPNSTPSSTRP